MIYYLTYFNPIEFKDLNLKVSPACDQKSKYIIQTLDKLNKKYTIIDLAETGNKSGLYARRKINYLNNGELLIFSGFGKPNRLFNKLHYYFRKLQLLFFLKNLNENDIVISYHSLITSKIFFYAKKKIGFNFILELEEKYQDVGHCSKKDAYWENKVITFADAFILASKSMECCIPGDKPDIVCNGTYHVEPLRNIVKDDNIIHCVYAGTFDSKKGGVEAAIKTAEYLSNNYHMHILGFGKADEIESVKELINNTMLKTKCKITYDGLKLGEEYISFLQKCDIGLCTQTPDAKFVNTSFPSKILVYLANGLRVISANMDIIKKSDIGKIIYYYESQTPESIANTISNIDCNLKYDSREILKKLDIKFNLELNELIEKYMEENDE